MREFDEECRLCYVGATRAKQYLYLSHAQNRRIFGRPPKPRQLSRFVTAMGFKDPNAHLASEHAFGGRTDAYLRNWQKNRPQGRKPSSQPAITTRLNSRPLQAWRVIKRTASRPSRSSSVWSDEDTKAASCRNNSRAGIPVAFLSSV